MTKILRALQIYKKRRFLGFWDFWISGFLHFFGFLAISSGIKELPEIRGCQNDHDLFVIVYLVFFCICVCVSVFVFVFVFVFLSFFCIFVFLIFSNHHHHHHHHHRLISLPPGQWWLSRFSNELFSNFSRLPEVRFRSPKKGKSSEFNSRDDGIIIWKV